jgi:hypothetical protein
VDLTFAIRFAASARSECQIRNSTRTLFESFGFHHLRVCLPQQDANVRIGPLASKQAQHGYPPHPGQRPCSINPTADPRSKRRGYFCSAAAS